MNLVFDMTEFTRFRDRLGDFHVFHTYLMTATQEVARVLHTALKQRTPILTGNLRAGWSRDGNLDFYVQTVPGGFMVEFQNTADNNGHMYGRDVNYGHRSFNQYGGSYGFVPGRFFVEKSIVYTETKLNKLIYDELEKWIRWCVNG